MSWDQKHPALLFVALLAVLAVTASEFETIGRLFEARVVTSVNGRPGDVGSKV